MNGDDLSRRKAQLSEARRALLQKRLQGKQADTPTAGHIVKRAQDGLLPLSYTQQRVWLLQQLFPDNRAYNMSEAWRLRGALDRKALHGALQEIVRRHASLRTSFVAPNDEPRQLIAAEIDLALPLADLSHLPPPAREEQMREMVLAEANHAFDLSRAPLIRPSLIRLASDEHILQIVLHHIITDEWSNDIIWRELNTLLSLSEGTAVDVPPEPAIQYSDFAQWQREQVQAGRLDPQMRYWREQLRGDLPLLALPFDHPRRTGQSLRGGMVRRTLPADLLAALHALSRQSGASLYMTLLAAFQALIFRSGGQEDILLGTPIANRQRPETKDVTGMFINTAVIRAQLSPEMSFQQLLDQVQQTVLDALANQDLPFDLLVRALQPERDLSYNPLFQAMFVYRDGSGERTLPGLQVEPVRIDQGVAKFDLTLFAGEADGRLYSAFEYSSDLFDAATVERMLDHWQTLLEGITADPQTPLAALPLLTSDERDLLLNRWNDSAAAPPQSGSLHERISEQAARTPQALAVITENEQLTYAELEARANRLARRLAEHGVGPGTPAGLFVERSAGMVVGILGILKAGGAYVPLAPDYPPQRIAFALADTGAPVVVTQSHLLESLPSSAAVPLILDEDPALEAGSPAAAPQTAVTLDDLAYIIYTSGSTGTPKGVMVSHRNLLASTLARSDYYQEPVGRFLLLSSFAFDSSVAGIFWTLAGGGALVLPAPDEEKDVQKLAAIIARFEVTHTLALPALYRLLLAYAPQQSLATLRAVIVAGEACPPDLGQMHYGRLPGCALFNEYGPTEATVWCSVHRLPRRSSGGSVPIGRPVSSSRLYILDPLQQLVPVGVPGELYVGGAGVTPGYWNNPELTAERFPTLEGYPETGRVYRTGDLARWLSNGEVEFLGRIDNQVKIRGFRIELGEIEARLTSHPAVLEAALIVAEPADGSASRRRLVAYVAAAQGAAGTESSALHSYLSEKLPEYMVPAQIIFLPALPRTPNGKIDAKQLPQPGMERERPSVPPRTPAEQILAHIWCEILNLDAVSVDDRFFSLGGDSLMSIQVIARARQEGLFLTPRQLFEEQTIARLAAAAKTTDTGSRAAADHSPGPLPLTPIQHWFFEQQLADPAHWNQAAWFETARGINHDTLSTALAHVVQRHPMLRARYRQRDDGWQQEVMAGADGIPLTLISLSNRDREAQDAAMIAAANSLHGGFDLASGPLLQGALFDLGGDRPPRLLLIIHHLVVDAVSWRIITADLITAYRQTAAGEEVSLPAPPASYAQWANSLAQLAAGEAMRRELAYWQREVTAGTPLPRDAAHDAGNSEGEAGLLSVSLAAEQTARLLRDAHQAYNTRIDDLLLAALTRAMARWTGELALLLTVERHGREELDPRLDISQTVGWFTALFPLTLNLEDLDDIGGTIRGVKEKLRQVPNSGVGFGLLRYLGDDQSREALAALPRPELLFNYLGQSTQPAAADTILHPLPLGSGQAYGPRNKRAHLLDINARVVDGRLTLNWQYAAAYFQAATIQGVAGSFVAELNAIIDHCLQADQSSFTPSDFPLAALQQEDLDSLSDLLAGLD